MSTNFLLKIGIALLLVAVFFYMWDKSSKSTDEGGEVLGKFGVIIVGGILAAFLIGVFVVPMFGDFAGTFIYGSGEKIQDDGSGAAAAKLAQGDYEGAVEEYEKLAVEKPGESHPVWEAAKIRAEKLEDPEGGRDFLTEQLEAQEWDEDNAAFLMFRLAEVHKDHLDDFDTATDVLRQVVGTFTGTRHAANATSTLRKWERELMEGGRPQVDPQLPGGGDGGAA